MLNKLTKLLNKYRKTLTALLIRAAVMALQFVMQIVLVWAAGAVGAGIYALYQAWMAIFSRVTGLGSTTHSLRTVSVLAGRGEGPAIRRYILRISAIVLSAGTIVGLAYVLFSSTLAATFMGSADLAYVVIAAALGGVFTNLLKVGAESLKGLGRVNFGLLLEWAVLPSVVMVTAGLLAAIGGVIDMQVVLYVHVLFILLVAITLFFAVSSSSRVMNRSEGIVPALGLRQFSPLWGGELAVVWFMNIPLLLLPQFVSLAELGIFSIALKLILIVQAVLVVLSSIYGPKFAQKFEQGDISGLLGDIRETQLISMVLYAPLFLAFMLVPEYILGLFDEEFKSGADWLRVMAIGQLAYAAFGLSDFVLNMANQEKVYLWINLGSTALMIVLSYLLMSNLGTLGASIAVAVSVACKQGFAFLATRRFLQQELYSR